jgi:hypothetical protein
MLVAALGWGLFIKTYMSGPPWRGQALEVTELAPACNQLLNFNLRQVNDVRLNLHVGVHKLTDLTTSIQEKSRELSGLEAQIEAKRMALAQPAAATAEVPPLTPSRACP